MIWLFTVGLCATLAAPPDDSPADSAERVQKVRTSSASRLRMMMGAHSEGPPLLRPEVLQAIDARHPKLVAAEAQLSAAEADYSGSLSYIDPTFESKTKAGVAGYYQYLVSDNRVAWDLGIVEAEVGWRLGRDMGAIGIPDYYGELDTLDNGELRVGLSVDILEGLWTDEDRTGRRVAGLTRDQAQALVRLARLDLSRKAVAVWAKWVSSGRVLNLEEVLLDVATVRQQAVDARISVGDLAAIEQVRNRQFMAQREAEVAGARADFDAAVQALALHLRVDDGTPRFMKRQHLPDRVDAPEGAPGFSADPVRLAIEGHPLIVVARTRLGIAEADARLARFGRMPEITLEGQISQDVGSQTNPSLQPMDAVVGAGVKLPLGNLKDRAKAASARSKRDKAMADVGLLEDQIDMEVRAALAREQGALRAWKASAEQVDLGLQLQEAEQRRFDVGDIDLLRLWQIEQQTAKAILSEVKAWLTYQVAVADLEYAVGQPASGSP
ncbi:MAG: TolC family protein [Myxococcota bacterium]